MYEMKFAIIDNNVRPMEEHEGRGKGFVDALADWQKGQDYEFVRYDEIAERRKDLQNCRGLVLSGSKYDLAHAGDHLDREVYGKMIPEFELVMDFQAPVLGVCFGHQFLALAEEFRRDRTAFGKLRLRNMPEPEDYLVRSVQMHAPLRFMDQRELWVQFNHKLEVVLNDTFQEYFEVVARSGHCRVEIMQHKSREWFGVQFHPEIGAESRLGETGRQSDAIRDGHVLIRDFVRYCLR